MFKRLYQGISYGGYSPENQNPKVKPAAEAPAQEANPAPAEPAVTAQSAAPAPAPAALAAQASYAEPAAPVAQAAYAEPQAPVAPAPEAPAQTAPEAPLAAAPADGSDMDDSALDELLGMDELPDFSHFPDFKNLPEYRDLLEYGDIPDFVGVSEAPQPIPVAPTQAYAPTPVPVAPVYAQVPQQSTQVSQETAPAPQQSVSAPQEASPSAAAPVLTATASSKPDQDPDLRKPIDGQDLLAQIDSFRDKALQLQALIAGKEGRVAALKKMVESQEKQLKDLQDELSVRQREASELSGNFERHIQSLSAGLRADMNAMQGRVEATLFQGNEAIKEQLNQQLSQSRASMSDGFDSVKATVEDIKSNVDGLESRIGEKIHSEDVTVYRNVADLAKEYDTREQLENLAKEQQSNLEKLEQKTRRLTIFAVAQTVLVVLALVAVVLL